MVEKTFLLVGSVERWRGTTIPSTPFTPIGFLFPSHPFLGHSLVILQTSSLPQDQLFIVSQVQDTCALSIEGHCRERRRAAAGAFFLPFENNSIGTNEVAAAVAV